MTRFSAVQGGPPLPTSGTGQPGGLRDTWHRCAENGNRGRSNGPHSRRGRLRLCCSPYRVSPPAGLGLDVTVIHVGPVAESADEVVEL